MPTPEEKPRFRRLARQRIRDLDPAERLRAETELCARLRPLGEQFPTIAAFWPLPSEPDIRPVLRHWLADGTGVCLPKTQANGSMSFYRTSNFEALVRSPLGVLEPDPDICSPQEAADLSLVLVPGLAFTLDGQRLGRGGGYYDRFLATLPPEVQTLGIALPCQFFQSLPTEPHDFTIDGVINSTVPGT